MKNLSLGELLFLVAAFAVILWILHSAFVKWDNQPWVYKSWSTKECTKVESRDPKHSCKKLPEHYETIWVE